VRRNVVIVLVDDAGLRTARQQSRDVSEGGAFIVSDCLFELDELLPIDLVLPSGMVLRATARVAWVSRGSRTRPAGMGLEFTDLDPDERALVAGELWRR
jgi:Tfp pilus assembly protein PilZ